MHVNAAFLDDEPGIFPTNGNLPDLPPSYEDVMRLPSFYPKVAPSPVTQSTIPSYNQTVIQTHRNHNETRSAVIEVTNIEEPSRIDSNNNHQANNQSSCLGSTTNIAHGNDNEIRNPNM